MSGRGGFGARGGGRGGFGARGGGRGGGLLPESFAMRYLLTLVICSFLLSFLSQPAAVVAVEAVEVLVPVVVLVVEAVAVAVAVVVPAVA